MRVRTIKICSLTVLELEVWNQGRATLFWRLWRRGLSLPSSLLVVVEPWCPWFASLVLLTSDPIVQSLWSTSVSLCVFCRLYMDDSHLVVMTSSLFQQLNLQRSYFQIRMNIFKFITWDSGRHEFGDLFNPVTTTSIPLDYKPFWKTGLYLNF